VHRETRRAAAAAANRTMVVFDASGRPSAGRIGAHRACTISWRLLSPTRDRRESQRPYRSIMAGVICAKTADLLRMDSCQELAEDSSRGANAMSGGDAANKWLPGQRNSLSTAPNTNIARTGFQGRPAMVPAAGTRAVNSSANSQTYQAAASTVARASSLGKQQEWGT